MFRVFSTTVLLSAAMALTSCASLTPPVRPAYTGADSVSTASSSQLVGVWTVNNLNPYPDAEPQRTTIEYKADGSVLGQVIPEGESAKALGNMTFEMTGNWRLDGDMMTHENMEMNVITEDDNKMLNVLGNLFSKKNGLSGQANIYELSANRIVMVGSDGGAMEYVRQ